MDGYGCLSTKNDIVVLEWNKFESKSLAKAHLSAFRMNESNESSENSNRLFENNNKQISCFQTVWCAVWWIETDETKISFAGFFIILNLLPTFF